jgi:hypothetical protein
MGVTTTNNKPFNPRGNDQSPKGYNRAKLYSGKALDFDGVNDIVNTTYTSGFTGAQEFTYCAYINTDTNQNSQAIIHADENAGWGLQSLQIRTETNGIRFLAGTGSALTSYVDSEVVEANKWYFVVGTHTPTENKIYINGVLNATATADNLTTAPDAIIVGAYPALANPYNGQITNAKVFNTALTAAQVADLYNNPEKVVPTGVDNTALKLWLPMMEGAGTTAYDGSGNGNHGTIAGATYVNGIGAPVAQSAVMDWNKGSNLLTYSEDFTQWTGNGLSSTIADDTTAPNGLLKADKIIENTSTNFHRWFQQIVAGSESGSNQSYTISGFVKYIDRQYISIGLSDNAAYNGLVNFDLINGTIGGEYTYNGSTFSNKTITDVGNDWWKFSVTITSPTWSGGSVYAIGFFQESSSVSTGFYIGQSKSVHVWGWNAAKENYITSYIPTIATAQTSEVLLPQGLTTGRDITGVNLFENVRKQGALNLDGKSWAEVHDNESLDVTAAVSVEAWVYWDGTSTDDGILGKWGDASSDRCYMLYVSTSTEVRIFINSESVLYNSMTTGWHHIVGTYDKAELKLFINGVRESISTSFTGDIQTSDKPIEIGQYRYGLGTRKHTNQIAQPRIYNRALTAEEVQRNYNSGKNTYTND